MKRTWLFSILTALAAVAAVAQDTTPVSPNSAVAPAQPNDAAPAPKKAKKSATTTVVLDPPVLATVKAETVNFRGRPDFVGEVLGHLQKGESVTVVAEVKRSHPAKGEPAQWAQIVMPTNVLVWVDSQYVDDASHTVKARRLHLRGGPGENYSVVGMLPKGAAINVVQSKNGWLAIAAPTNAYCYVAAEFLDMQPAAAVATATPANAPAPEATPAPAPAPAPAPTETVNVATPAPVAPVASAPAPAPADNSAPPAPAPTPQSEVDQELAAVRRASIGDTATVPAPAPETAPGATQPAPTPETTAPSPAPETASTNVEPRVVTREGIVHRAYNIQAPADYELRDVDTGNVIDYLQPQTAQKFKIYVGTRVDVTGPEYIDQRWPRTPVLQVTNVQLVP